MQQSYQSHHCHTSNVTLHSSLLLAVAGLPNAPPRIIQAIAIVIMLVCALSVPPARAGTLFSTFAQSGSDQFSANFEKAEDAFDQLTTARLQAALPSYTDPASTATMQLDFRGLDMNFSFQTSGSTELTMSIPALGINESFTGSSRDDSKDLLVEYFKGAGLASIERIQKELVRVSPVDPIAGNPNSLMSSQMANDFATIFHQSPTNEFAVTDGGGDLLARAFGADAQAPRADAMDAREGSAMARGTDDAMQESARSGYDSRSADGQGEQQQGGINPMSYEGMQGSGSSFGVDVSHAQYDLNGRDSSTQTIVLDYLYQFQNPQKILRVSLPIAVTDTEGAKSYRVNAGLSYSHPITRAWSLTPGVSYGVGGSEDLGGGASINGISLSSTYRLVYGDYLYKIGNMVGRYQTGSVSFGDYEINPDVSNTVLRNGVMVLRPTLLFNVPSMVQAYFIDTRFSGDELYAEKYYEVGFALGILADDRLLIEDNFHLGLTWLDSTDSDIKGYKINFGFNF
ncbi:MAG: hypothetical protein R3183_02455 [Oleiphilaceae bacterium]|nr:hypothetical protein [Oleiphilaceae bacterium]